MNKLLIINKNQAAFLVLFHKRSELGVYGMEMAIFRLRLLASINTHPWDVYGKKNNSAIFCFLHYQWLIVIDIAETSLYRASAAPILHRRLKFE